jgi:hypothetical protein
MPKAYAVVAYHSVSDPQKLAAYNQYARSSQPSQEVLERPA